MGGWKVMENKQWEDVRRFGVVMKLLRIRSIIRIYGKLWNSDIKKTDTQTHVLC